MGGTNEIVEEDSVDVVCVDDVSAAVVVSVNDVPVTLVCVDDVSIGNGVLVADVPDVVTAIVLELDSLELDCEIFFVVD